MAKATSGPPRLKKDGVDTGELVLDGKGRARMRKPGPKAWTREKEKKFLSVLGDTCNVKLAAAEAGVSPQHAYARRKSHAAFRAGWVDAIGVAYNRLELILLDRALNGTERIITRRDGSEERMVDYSNQVALTLLKMHRDTAIEADTDVLPEDLSELRASIETKLGRLRRQEEARKAGDANPA
jgi:hypothetical protein